MLASMSDSPTTRLAPSPTGALHLGNMRTFLVNALLARTAGWRMLMRVEDLDGPRVKPGATDQAIDELAWLGLSWEGQVMFQSDRTGAYEAALERLIGQGAAYPCVCSRKDVLAAASAPHAEDRGPVYPGACRGRFGSPAEATAETGRPVAWRVEVPDETIAFEDGFAGPQAFNLARETGDFVVYRNEGLAGYQLAVVVDDEASGVDRIVRGDDLLDSTARQIHVRRLLGYTREVRYWHLPLVIGPDGRRLAKRHGDTRLAYYRRRGCPSQRVLGLLGYWCGLLKRRREIGFDELAERFDLTRIPSEPVVFRPDDDAFLLGR